ncbi:hypothetical protein [Vibrio sp. 1F279]|uniref:hypothetical protein n=1 Tax=unclassified Vibrio TaxID=2614977 RepID=UPI00352C1000
MLKKSMTTLLFTGVFSASVSAKVTLDDANTDAEWYAQQNAHLSDTLLPMQPDEFDQNAKSGANQLGIWVKTSSSVTQWENAGAYAQVISPNATGQSCIKGAKALISNQYTGRECTSYNSNGTICTGYKTTVITPTDSGYKAECQ